MVFERTENKQPAEKSWTELSGITNMTLRCSYATFLVRKKENSVPSAILHLIILILYFTNILFKFILEKIQVKQMKSIIV